ncbi:hypothetical protein F0Z19_1620 [Vibrio cyclitrophicus]|nr:hypothetical protein M565_ctg5P0449 [Vibrio cyclitrophicus FF75]KAA8601114.1 hypothetical protein F0Z19_1620 [Vibrio cyclitrophicus]
MHLVSSLFCEIDRIMCSSAQLCNQMVAIVLSLNGFVVTVT